MSAISPVTRMAQKIVNHSLRASRDENIYIDVVGRAEDLVNALLTRIPRRGANPFLKISRTSHLKKIILESDENHFKSMARQEIQRLSEMDAYIGIKEEPNIYELSDIPSDKYQRFVNHYLQPVQHKVLSLDKWVLLKAPVPSMAQLARMSYDAFRDIYYNACNMDYRALKKEAMALANLLKDTQKVTITAPDTALSFTIAPIDPYICDGRYNLPDGEVFTAPVAESVNGTVRFNVPTSYMGKQFDYVELRFVDGEIVEASSNDSEALWSILKTDQGSSRVGEFGIGLNPYILRPMHNLLFDEKMAGSLHLALGHAFEVADNGNRSSIHWDLVLCQTAAHGGGDLYFDDVLIRKDGRFVRPELMNLNP